MLLFIKLKNIAKQYVLKNSCQLMSKEFSNDKGITSKHDDRVNLVKDRGITKSNRKSVKGSMTGEILAKRVVIDNSLKR